MTPMDILSRIRCVKTVYLPDWATHIHLITGAGAIVTVPAPYFLEHQTENQLVHESLCARVYAGNSAEANTIKRSGIIHLRSRGDRLVKLLGSWNDYHLTWLRFEPAPGAEHPRCDGAACVPAPL